MVQDSGIITMKD